MRRKAKKGKSQALVRRLGQYWPESRAGAWVWLPPPHRKKQARICGPVFSIGAGSRNVENSLEASFRCFAACGSAPVAAGSGERPSDVHWTSLSRTGVPDSSSSHHQPKEKARACGPFLLVGAGSRNRTGTISLPLDFESSASTSSAIPALQALRTSRPLVTVRKVLCEGRIIS